MMLQMLRYWPFGGVWCRFWLAIDVWLCTASIYNLCAISIDRYLAISRPVKYPTLMSSKRARFLIIAVWILSFVICFPPLIGGWNDLEQTTVSNCSSLTHNVQYRIFADASPSYELNTNVLVSSTDDGGGGGGGGCGQLHEAAMTSRPVCTLTADPGYIVYSACGSFWVPMLGMVGFYWKIYKTAVAATAAYKRGVVEQKTSGLSSSTSDNALCTLRVHRGGSNSSILQRHSNGCLSELLPRPSAAVIQASRRSVAGTGSRASYRRAAVVAADSSPGVMPRPVPQIVITGPASCTEDDFKSDKHDSQTTEDHRRESKTSDSKKKKNKKPSRESRRRNKSSKHDAQLTTQDAGASTSSGNSEAQTADGAAPKKEKRKSSFLGLFDGDSAGGDRRLSLQIAARFAKLHIISQLRSLNKEKKAAKTVGIIVGCFT